MGSRGVHDRAEGPRLHGTPGDAAEPARVEAAHGVTEAERAAASRRRARDADTLRRSA
ncbi:hypothetical protein BVI434_940018 [Burkholderia vietnamiensis]|nr:hypothetical protein BVI434_940018 [Burkholderia vietnamiensis]